MGYLTPPLLHNTHLGRGILFLYCPCILMTTLHYTYAVSILKHARTPPANPGMVDYQNPEHEQLMKRLRSAQSVEEVSFPLIFISWM